MSISPFDPVPPLVVPAQANATNAAEMRTASPLARTIRFPLVFIGRPTTNRTTAFPHSPPSSQPTSSLAVGARVRRRRMRPHGVAEPLLRSELWTRERLQVKHSRCEHAQMRLNVSAPQCQYGSVVL